MGRKYTVAHFFDDKSTAGPLLTIESASTKVTKLCSVRLEQNTDYGDAAAEGLRLQIARGSGASGGTAKTPTPVSPGDAAFAGAVRAADTTPGTFTTVLVEGGMNIQAGWLWTPTEKFEIEIAPSGALQILLATAPADIVDFEITAELEELG